MRKMLASDLDGTLLFKGKVSEENKDALKKLKKDGGIFSISTGRPYNDVKGIVDILDVEPDYIIVTNGALILNNKEEIIHKKELNHDIIRKVLEDTKNVRLSVSVETGFNSFIIVPLSKQIKIKFRMIVKSILCGTKIASNKKFVKGFDNIKNVENEGFSLIAMAFDGLPPKEIQAIADDLNKKYGDHVECFRNTKFIDVVPKGCSKGHGVKQIVDIESLHLKNVYTIGDSWNDDSMFEITNNSFTFHHAEEELQKRTDYVVEDVAECIYKYILE